MTTVRFGLVALLLVTLANAQTPAVNAGGIVNSASYSTGGVAPGSVVSIFGTNLANQTASAGSTPLPTSLANVTSVTFNGVTAGLYFVTSSQINAEVPWNVLSSGASGMVNVVVTTSNGTSAPQAVQVVPAMPGIFTATANGLGQGIATNNTDNAIAMSTTLLSGVDAHPIQIGDYLIIWCTGLGAVDMTIPNGGNTGGQIANTVVKPTVSIGGVQATPVYSVLSPQFAGEYQIGVRVAAGTPTGTAVPVQIQVSGTTTSNSVTIAVAPAPPAQPMEASCTLTSTGCPAITLNGDPPSDTKFAGYADPSIREDPQTGTLWMAYSWPHTLTSGSDTFQVIDTHLSFSTDGGNTWNYKGPLYVSQAVTNPVTGQTNYTAHEVANLFPQVVNGVTYWYAIHSVYYVPAKSGGGSGLESYTKRWEIAVAPGTPDNGPLALANAPPQFLGQAINTFPQDFPVAQVLTSLNPELNACAQFYEPTLVMAGDDLYLFLSCTPDARQGGEMFYAAFKTSDPSNHSGNWRWSYIPQGAKKFADAGDAASVGSYLGTGATYLTQMDIAPSKTPGQLVAIVTAAYNDFSGKVSLGCAAVELAGLDPPRFVYNAQGQVQVDAVIKSPDSQGDGPGSCTYSPGSATGMIMAHRQTSNAPQNGGFFLFLMQSLLFP